MSNTNTASEQRAEKTLAGTWQLDTRRSSVQFETPHFWGLVTVKGHFAEYEGRLDLSAQPAIELTIDAASIQTGNAKRDRHLRSADFFDADNHPRVRFISESVVPRDDRLRVRGRLAARDQSIPVELDAQIRHVGGELTIEAATTAAHAELGMTYSPLKMIPRRSELRVEGYLVPAA